MQGTISAENVGAQSELALRISQLPEEERLVLCLYQVERLSLEQIAGVLDDSEDRVAALFYRAMVGVGAAEPIEESLAAA